MLVSKIKEIKNGRVIMKDNRIKDAVRPGDIEIGKTLFYHGREGDVVSVRGDKIILNIDGEKYTVNATEVEPGTTGDSKSKDAYDPTKPKNIAAAKKLAKAQGAAAADRKK